MKMTKLLMMFLLIVMISGAFATQAKIGSSPIATESDHDEDDDGIDDDEEEAYERDIETEENADRFRVESKMRNGDVKDEFDVEFKVALQSGDEPEIRMEYSTEANDLENELEYRVNFDQILEFYDNGTTPGYDESDTVVGTPYELDKHEWNDLVYTEQVINGEIMKVVTATTTDGVVSIILKVSTAIINLDNNTIITPTSIKIDIHISNFSYAENGTYLTLQTDIKTSSETEHDEISEDEENGFAQNESEVHIASQSANGFFSWAEWAEADGEVIDVLSSTLRDASETEKDDDLEDGEFQRLMYFTFDAQNPSEIIWDPKVGVESQATANYLAGGVQDGDKSLLPGFAFFMVSLSIFVVSLVSRRKRAKLH